MAHQIIEITTLDGCNHFRQTNYYCSECNLDCGKQIDECPHCGVFFNDGSIFKDNEHTLSDNDF